VTPAVASSSAKSLGGIETRAGAASISAAAAPTGTTHPESLVIHHEWRAAAAAMPESVGAPP
jgi:hypothetical protein